ncbi:MAG TPA: hypothetical protein VEB03_01425 [Candidatus Nanoarchaeia archaeon]|nr:hypothetical protein [Candidatus Nanoarchaeia archaeon]
MDKTKNYKIRDIEVTSFVAFDKLVQEPTGETRRHVRVESTCPSKRWGHRTEASVYSCPDPWPDFEALFEKFRSEAADALVKHELGLSPDGTAFPYLGVRVGGKTGKSVNTIGLVDLASPTRVSMDLVEMLDLLPNGRWWIDQDSASKQAFALREAEIVFDPFILTMDVLPTQMGLPCIIGGDFVQRAIGENQDLLQQFLLPDYVRALKDVAKAKKHCVLIAGKYGEERDRLFSLKQAMKERGYTGLILDEFPDIEEQSLTEKFVTFASIARFVVVDDSAPAGHIAELEICSERRFTTVLLRPNGKGSTFVQADIADDVHFIKVFEYSDPSRIGEVLGTALDWAEAVVTQRAENLNRKYNWRSPIKIMK